MIECMTHTYIYIHSSALHIYIHTYLAAECGASLCCQCTRQIRSRCHLLPPVYIYVYIIHTHAHAHTYTRTYIYMYIIKCIYNQVWIYNQMYMYTYIHIHTYTHIYIYIILHTHTQTRTHTHTNIHKTETYHIVFLPCTHGYMASAISATWFAVCHISMCTWKKYIRQKHIILYFFHVHMDIWHQR